MQLAETSIRRPVFATVLSLLILLIGGVSFDRLSLREYPKIDEPTVTVSVKYPGASAEVIESQVTKPLEDSIAGIDAVEVEAQQIVDGDQRLKIRLFSMISASDPELTEYWLNTAPVVASEDSRLTLNAFKVVMDGALGSRTAWLHEPYSDDPTTVGLQTADADRLAMLMERSRVNGWQINTHAIGDRANSVVLDTIERVMPEGGDHRFRIEHSQHLRPEDIERFERLGVIASIQTIHLSSNSYSYTV